MRIGWRCCFVALVALATTTGAWAINAGDIALIGYQADNPDTLAFVALADIPPGTEIRFTDCGWQLAGGFRASEGGVQFTAASLITAGTVVQRAYPFDSGEWSVNNEGFSNNLALSTSGDQILAFEGVAATPTFLYAINNDDAGWSDATSSNTTALPTGLVDGTTAVNIGGPPELDNGYYDPTLGITTGSQAELLAAISDSSNWTKDDGLVTFPTWSFTVTGGPTTGACCVGEVCSVETQDYCENTLGGVYQGNGTDCDPNPCLSQPCSTIAEAKAAGPDVGVRLCEVVVASITDLVSSANSKSFTVQDATGGITVYGTNEDIDGLLTGIVEGDAVTLEGMTGEFASLFQLNSPFTFISDDGFVGVPTPITATSADFQDGSPTAEGLESMLVRVECVYFADAGGTFEGMTDYAVTDATGAFVVRVATNELNLVGTTIPTSPIDVVGVLSQYDFEEGTSGYQLQLRSTADLIPNAGCPDPSGACCVGEVCTIVTQFECEITMGGVYQGDGTSCDPNPCVELPCSTIADARVAGTGVEVRLCDAVIASATDLVSSSTVKSFTLQDATGGITVYGSNEEIDAILGTLAFEGDSITLEGFTDSYNGLFELSAEFTFISNNGYVGVPAPVIVFGEEFDSSSPTAEDYESELVTVECVTFADGGGTFQGLTNYTVSDATGSFTVRVATGDLDLIGEPIPEGTVNVTGVFSQYGGYQLLVRSIADIVDNPNCGPATGACCVAGTCTVQAADDCAMLGGEYIGDGTACEPGICPVPVYGGDIALGLSQAVRFETADHVRGGVKVGSWTSEPYFQSMEFDNSGGILHSATGNLLATAYGPDPQEEPDPNLHGGTLYNVATNGTNGSEVLYRWNTLLGGIETTRIGSVSVSPNNEYVAAFGTDTKNLYVLEYNAGAAIGTGSGAAITNAWAHVPTAVPGGGTQGTKWLDDDTVLLYTISFIPGLTDLSTVDFDAGSGSFVQTVRFSPAVTGMLIGTDGFTSVEYNPNVSPYVYCLYSTFTDASYTTLTVVDPATWTQVNQIQLGGSLETGRELALGPDGYLYISQYAGGSGVRSYIDRLDTADAAIWTDNTSLDYYMIDGPYSTYNGLDVAFGEAQPTGACCIGELCSVVAETFCLGAGGTYLGDGTSCVPNPCLGCSTIPEAKAVGTGVDVKLCEVVVSSTIDLVSSTNSKSFQVQEATGLGGITVYGGNDDIDALLALCGVGDSITIQGTTDAYANLFELAGPFAFHANHGYVGVTPTTVTSADLLDLSPTAEALESMLVTIECVTFTETGLFEGAASYTASDDSGSFTVRVPTYDLDLVGQPIPTDAVTLTGIFSQFSFSDPQAGYQFLLRGQADITPCQELCAGDMDCDGDIDFDDINPFVEALAGAAVWPYPDCPWLNGDCDGDGDVDFDDINPFVALIGTTCP